MPVRKKKKVKPVWANIALIAVFLVGIGLLLYPYISDYMNSLHSSRVITDYTVSLENVTAQDLTEWENAAKRYNAVLSANRDRFHPTEESHAEYMSLLDPNKSGLMSILSIPKINVNLPVFHTTESSVLQRYAGHMEGSSLPVGGAGTHTVLSGHRGLPSAVLFSDLDALKVGDQFTLRTLNEILTYEVDQIIITKPNEADAYLEIEEGKDYCTLFTCHPYGVNTERLLVRGYRVATEHVDSSYVAADATTIDPVLLLPLFAVPLLLILLVVLLVFRNRRKRQSKIRKEARQLLRQKADEKQT